MSRNQRSATRPLSMPLASCQVAVIGAGAAGLVTARELRREGHSVVVFERGDQVGGTWVYTPRVESDPLGLDPTRTIVHSSLYSSLRSNLPREAMGFRDYPFVPRDDPGRDPRRFPGHREVHMYLVDFAREFGIAELVRLKTEVVRVGLVEGSKWRVTSRKEGEGETDVDEIFDAIVVCNGHFSEPLIAEVPGISKWPGKQIHSHNYRVPEPFRGQTVVLIGGSASAMDISRDIAGVAREVHVAARRLVLGGDRKQSGYDNLWLHPMTESVEEDGTVHFEDGSSITADAIIHCTGYKYDFPFLDTNGLVTVDDNRVGPLYKHVFPLALAPWLSFVGIPRKVFTFPLSESQSKWIAGVLSGRLKLPSQQEMMEEIKAFYSSLEVSGTPKRHTHDLHDLQFEHYEWLAAQCGGVVNEEWRKVMLYSTIKNVLARPDNFRDEWEDDDLFVQAYKDFINYTTNHFGD